MAREVRGAGGDMPAQQIVARIMAGRPVPPADFARFLKGLGRYLADKTGDTPAQVRQGIIDGM